MKILKFTWIPALFLFVSSCESETNVSTVQDELQDNSGIIPSNAENNYPLTKDVFKMWFEDDTITKEGQVSAANSLDFTNSNNSDFYKWSYRMFLWITSKEDDGTRVFDSQTFYDVAPAGEKGMRKLIKHEPGVHRNFAPRLLQTRNKDAALDETEQGQAGGGDVLMSKNGSLVYYTLMVNDVMAVFRTMHGNSIPNQFPCDSLELDSLVQYGKNILGVDIDDKNALAMELKLSWVEVGTLSNPEDYIQIDARIPVYEKDQDNKVWKSTGRDSTAKLALIGMHVVGNAKGHPEMLWATFEHQTNTPQDKYTYVTTNGTIDTVDLNTSGEYLFCANGASGPYNIPYMKMSSDTIKAIGNHSISASNTTLVNSWGAAYDTIPNPLVSSVAQSNSEVISLNHSIQNYLVDGDKRKNYMLIGCTWTQDGGYPYSPIAGNKEVNYPVSGPTIPGIGAAVGTSRLANSTMETYHQSDNCFDCHNNFTSENTVEANINGGGYTDLSHIFSNLVFLDSIQKTSGKK